MSDPDLVEELSSTDAEIRRLIGEDDLIAREQVASALVRKGRTLNELGRHDEELVTYEEVVDQFGDASEVELQEKVAWALYNEARTLLEVGSPEEAAGLYAEVARRFEHHADPRLRVEAARALIGKAFADYELDQPGEAIDAFDRAAQAAADIGNDNRLAAQAARALANKGWLLAETGDHGEAVRVLDEVVTRFDGIADSEVTEQIGSALFNKAAVLQHEEPSEALVICTAVMKRWGDNATGKLAKFVADAGVLRGVLLAKSGRAHEALASYRQVAAQFEGSDDPELRAPIAQALSREAAALALAGQASEAVKVNDRLLALVDGDKALEKYIPVALYNKAVQLEILGRLDEANSFYEDVVARFAGLDGAEVELAVRNSRARLAGGD